uniref:SHH signaling and ciliogenesis regulator sdccag8 n=1 Tax=Scleropages formosus TaxID=113540 RepID=A0A8C9V6J7_SCLFO
MRPREFREACALKRLVPVKDWGGLQVIHQTQYILTFSFTLGFKRLTTELKSVAMESKLGSDEEEFGNHQKELREKANRSIRWLTGVLAESAELVRDSNLELDSDSTAEDSWSQQKNSDPVNQLRALLQEQQKESGSPTSPKWKSFPQQRSSDVAENQLPSLQDLVPIIHNQSEYIQHLEAEVKFCKEELAGMKHRVRVVVLENEKLHKELKSRTVEDTLKDYTILDTTVQKDSLGSADGTSKPARSILSPTVPQQEESHRWQNELAQLRLLHQAQTETLEAQVMALRRELVTTQKEYEEVKGRLRHQEVAAAVTTTGGTPRVGGLCLKCAQHEAVLAQTHTSAPAQAVERLTRERDELMAALSSLRAAQAEVKQREWASSQQVKRAMEAAEEASLEKTMALVQCDQMRKELTGLRERLEKELVAEHERLAQAKEEAQSEARKEKEMLAQTVTHLSQKVADLEGQLDRDIRERSSLLAQLEEAQRRLTSQQEESSRVCGELRYQLTQAQLQREEAERELRDQVARNARQLEQVAQEAEKLGLELSGCRQRLEAAQQDASRARADALGLTERLDSTRRQLHLTRKEKDAAERCRSEEVASLAAQAKERERELLQRLRHEEAQHQRSVSKLDTLLSSQNSLIGKLKEECRVLGVQLEEVAEASRTRVEQLSLEKEHFQQRVEKLQSRCQEMEVQCVQHGRMHQRMKQRLQQLDQHCQASAQQVMELLSRQNLLVEERRVLSEEMQNLRVQPASHRPRGQRSRMGT